MIPTFWKRTAVAVFGGMMIILLESRPEQRRRVAERIRKVFSSSKATKKRVFISFDHDDRRQVDGLRLLNANDDFDVDFYDESLRTAVDSENRAYVRGVIRDKISRASITVCMIGVNTHKSEWVDWELEESAKKGNTIIAMGLKGIQTATLPKLIHDRVVAKTMSWYLWDHELLARLINNA